MAATNDVRLKSAIDVYDESYKLGVQHDRYESNGLLKQEFCGEYGAKVKEVIKSEKAKIAALSFPKTVGNGHDEIFCKRFLIDQPSSNVKNAVLTFR
jgi:hypothetical protein